MQNNVKNPKKGQARSADELNLIKKELAALKKHPATQPVFVLSDSGTHIRFLDTSKTYAVDLESALTELMSEVYYQGEIDVTALREEFEMLLDEVTEFMLPHVGVDQYMRYRALIRGCGYFFAQLITREEKRVMN